MNSHTLAASVLTGLATGPRSFTGLAAATFAAPRGAQSQPDRMLGHPAAKTAIGLLALQEWVMDKLPQTPSRLETLGLCTRAVGAGSAGAILARRAQVNAVTPPIDTFDGAAPDRSSERSTTPEPPDWPAIGACAATSAVVALGVAVIGVHLREGFEKAFGRDWLGAGLEDISSAALAAAAVYVSSGM